MIRYRSWMWKPDGTIDLEVEFDVDSARGVITVNLDPAVVTTKGEARRHIVDEINERRQKILQEAKIREILEAYRGVDLEA